MHVYVNWSEGVVGNTIYDTSDNTVCPELYESKAITSITKVFIKFKNYLTCAIPIVELLGISGCFWTIAVVLMSNHVSFIKTKYFYVAVFSADIVANIFMMGIDKSLLFLENFNPEFQKNKLTSRSLIMCKLTR